MRATWPIDLERAAHLVSSFLPLFGDVGEERFLAGVDAITAKRPATTEDGYRLGFPTPSELRSYVPPDPRLVAKAQQEKAEWIALQRERKANPDAFFGMADVVAMMRIVQEQRNRQLPIIADAILDEIVQARHLIQESHPK